MKKYWDVVLFLALIITAAITGVGWVGFAAIIVGIYSALKHLVSRSCDVFQWTCVFKKLP